MDHANFEIGTRSNEDGKPLILADGKVVGTVDEVKALIARYEAKPETKSYVRVPINLLNPDTVIEFKGGVLKLAVARVHRPGPQATGANLL